MSHMIENNQLAYVGAEPWHGLGVQMPEGATGEQMLAAANLAWRVQRRSLAMRPGNGDTTRMITTALDNFRAIVRSDNDHVFQVASDRYQPVQNIDVVNFFREYCDAGHARMETVGALRDGAVVWALAKLNGGSTAMLPGGDELAGYMLLATSHDGSLKTIGQPTQVRVVCHNTLTAAMGSKDATHTFSLRHSSKFDQAARDNARRVMGMAIAQVAAANVLAGELAKVTIDESGWLEFMGKLLGSADAVIDPKTAELTRVAADIQEATMVSPGSALASARGTLWGAVNGVTYYADWSSRARSQQNRMFSAWFGANDNLKTRAVEVAAELAGVTI
jgi:phage/plasmid-like protein (TIGR03299 family)